LHPGPNTTACFCLTNRALGQIDKILPKGGGRSKTQDDGGQSRLKHSLGGGGKNGTQGK